MWCDVMWCDVMCKVRKGRVRQGKVKYICISMYIHVYICIYTHTHNYQLWAERNTQLQGMCLAEFKECFNVQPLRNCLRTWQIKILARNYCRLGCILASITSSFFGAWTAMRFSVAAGARHGKKMKKRMLRITLPAQSGYGSPTVTAVTLCFSLFFSHQTYMDVHPWWYCWFRLRCPFELVAQWVALGIGRIGHSIHVL